MKKILAALALSMVATGAHAAAYDFYGTMVNVDAWTGTGLNETILVVDWNKLDQEENGVDIQSESHAFGYRWDGDAYENQMLQDFTDAGILNVTTGYGGGFVMNIGYWDEADNEVHMHIEEGSWNLGSTSDPTARWGTWGDSEWDFNTMGSDEELLADGQFEGINAIMYYGALPEYADNQLDIPLAASSVPVPAAAWLLGSGLLGLVGIRRRTNK